MEYFYNQKKNYGYYDQPTHPTGQTMAMAAMIIGILSVVTLWTLYFSIVLGGLGLIFAFLSKGFEKKFSNNAKMGFAFSAAGFFVSVFILIIFLLVIFHNPERLMEAAQQIDLMNPQGGFSYEEVMRQFLNSFN